MRPAHIALAVLVMAAWASDIVAARIGASATPGWMAVFAMPQMVALSLIFEHDHLAAIRSMSINTAVDIIYTGVIVSIVGHGLWYLLVPKRQTNQSMPFTLLIPVFGVAVGALALTEAVTWQIIAGGLVTIGGVAAIIFRRPVAAAVAVRAVE